MGDCSELVLGLLRPLQLRQSRAVTPPVELFARAILACIRRRSIKLVPRPCHRCLCLLGLVGAPGCSLRSAGDGCEVSIELGEQLLDIGRCWG
eukprot:1190946-Prorocentrum_minimum.AAC.1